MSGAANTQLGWVRWTRVKEGVVRGGFEGQDTRGMDQKAIQKKGKNRILKFEENLKQYRGGAGSRSGVFETNGIRQIRKGTKIHFPYVSWDSPQRARLGATGGFRECFFQNRLGVKKGAGADGREFLESLVE